MPTPKNEALKKWMDPMYIESIQPHIEAIAAGQDAVIERADLSGLDLNHPVIPALQSKSLFRSRLVEVDLAYACLGGNMNYSSLQGVNLSHAQLDRAMLSHCEIRHCNLANTKLIVNMERTVVEHCSFREARIGTGRLGLEYGGRRTQFHHCDFSGAVFRGVELRVCSFVNCVFDQVEFRGSLQASRFENCTFHQARFIDCNVSGVKLEGGVPPSADQFEKMDVPTWAYSDCD
ncbi:pentapeptide repeat-containing protein [Paenibacillus massiliensis]|uniref:pentapeptide repeat-containing protein n=1 Tax=Paenibacillus massiliensis TaxID=225917 RepID=UPI00037A8785|nr:pentapeptide repeat-containing protein [Paenibacillus massiliensis]